METRHRIEIEEFPCKKLELIFSREKETKNTIGYQEELGEEAHSSRDIAVGVLYVQKEVLGDPPPQRLRVIIEEG